MNSTSRLCNPRTFDLLEFDDETRQLLSATIEWFETRGLRKLTEDYHRKIFYQEFLDFVAETQLFAKFLTPEDEPGAASGARWDTRRNAALSEILGFYGMNYWYPWQVAALGLGPVWQSGNAAQREDVAISLAEGEVAAFAVSEREHGADICSTGMRLTATDDGYIANGSKYYIGNGNCARVVSVFGRIEQDPTDSGNGGHFVLFRADSNHLNFELVRNVVASQMYVAELRLNDYPVREQDILHRGDDAFSAALNTVNIGKFNLCFGGIGLCTHAFHDALNYASGRVLFGRSVTELPHVRAAFVDAYSRLLGMRLLASRAIDYMRCANREDRRYLLYNTVTKATVASEAHVLIGGLSEIVAAKSLERNSFFTIAACDLRVLTKFEGTLARNMALITKFMNAYLFSPAEFDDVPVRRDAANDDYLFRQGPTGGLRSVRFHDWRPAYKTSAHIPNVAVLSEQIEAFVSMLAEEGPSPAQVADTDFMITVGQLFTTVAYGHLVLEQVRLDDVKDSVVNSIFSTMVRDFSSHALQLYSKPLATEEQQKRMLSAIRRPAETDGARLWDEIASLAGSYSMRP